MLSNIFKKDFVTIILFALFFTSINWAQETLKLSLEQSLQIGLENSKVLHSSKMNVQYAQARLSEINTARLPSLSLGMSYWLRFCNH